MTNELSYILRLKDEASKTLQQFGDKLSQVSGKNIQDFGSSMVKIGAGFTAIGAGTALLTKSLVETASSFEQQSVAFNTLTGSMELGQKTLNDLVQFAAQTPFEIPQILEQSKRLMAMGTSAGDLIPVFRALGDVASGVGMEKLPQLVLAFGQIQARGQLMGTELRQLTEAGFNLADAMGVTNGALMEMVSNGEVSFEDVKNAFMSVTAEGGRFHDMMYNQSLTTAGQLSNLNDKITMLKNTMGEQLLPIVNQFIDKLAIVIEKIGNFAQEHPKLLTMLIALGLTIGVVGVAITALGTIIFAVGIIASTAFGGIILTIGGVIVVIGLLAVAFFLWRDQIMEFLNSIWLKFTEVFEYIKNLIVTKVDEWYQKHKWFIDLMIAIYTFMFNVLKTILETMFVVAKAIFEAMFNHIKTVLENLKNSFVLIFNTIKSVVETAINYVHEKFGDKLDAMSSKVSSFKDAIIDKFKALAEGITNALRSIKFPHLNIGEGSVNIMGKDIKYPKFNVDWYEKGGWVKNTGLAMVHQGEYVISKDMLNGKSSMPSSVTNNNNYQQPINVNAIINTPLDALTLGNILGEQLAFARV